MRAKYYPLSPRTSTIDLNETFLDYDHSECRRYSTARVFGGYLVYENWLVRPGKTDQAFIGFTPNHLVTDELKELIGND